MSQSDHNPLKKPNAKVNFVAGIVIIAAGIAISGQPWIKPPMFAAIDLDLSKVVINVGVVIAWIGLCYTFFYEPLDEVVSHRTEALESTFEEAEHLKQRMEEMKSSYEQRLSQTEADARAQIQAQLKEAQDLRQRLMSEASEKYDAMIAQGEADIEAERSRVIGELRGHVVDLTLKATEKLLNENVDSGKNRAIVEDFISKAGAGN